VFFPDKYFTYAEKRKYRVRGCREIDERQRRQGKIMAENIVKH
jgi:hypothetical protein